MKVSNNIVLQVSSVTVTMSDFNKIVFAKTIYGEARNSTEKGQQEVARVIRERAAQNKPEFGGNTIVGVCKKLDCWKDVDDILIGDPDPYWKIRRWSDALYDQPLQSDPNAPDYYNEPRRNGFPAWTKDKSQFKELYQIKDHVFYRKIN